MKEKNELLKKQAAFILDDLGKAVAEGLVEAGKEVAKKTAIGAGMGIGAIMLGKNIHTQNKQNKKLKELEDRISDLQQAVYPAPFDPSAFEMRPMTEEERRQNNDDFKAFLETIIIRDSLEKQAAFTSHDFEKLASDNPALAESFALEVLEKVAKHIVDIMQMTPEEHGHLGVKKNLESTVVINKPWYRTADSEKGKYQTLLREHTLNISPEEYQALITAEDRDKKKQILDALFNKGFDGTVGYRSPRPLLFGRKKFDEMASQPINNYNLIPEEDYKSVSLDNINRFYNQGTPEQLYNRYSKNPGLIRVAPQKSKSQYR